MNCKRLIKKSFLFLLCLLLITGFLCYSNTKEYSFCLFSISTEVTPSQKTVKISNPFVKAVLLQCISAIEREASQIYQGLDAQTHLPYGFSADLTITDADGITYTYLLLSSPSPIRFCGNTTDNTFTLWQYKDIPSWTQYCFKKIQQIYN